MKYAIAGCAFLTLVAMAGIIWIFAKPRTRWLIDRIAWLLFGVLFGATMTLSILSLYGG